MAEFQKLSEVEKLETASDNASVLIEEGGEIKRVPKKEVGGAGGVKTLIIKDVNYDTYLSGGTAEWGDDCAFTCVNMSFEEAHQLIAAGEPIAAVGMFVNTAPGCIPLNVWYTDFVFGVPSLGFQNGKEELTFFWTSNGFSYYYPSSGGPV